MTIVLETKGLSKSFGAIKAVSDVSFVLHKAELLAMIGPNGAGKSTCFNMLMGQLRTSRASAPARFGAWAWAAPSRSPAPTPR